MSRYDFEKFDPPPDPDLICCICQCVLDSPQESPCRHVFCKVCINQWLVKKHNCPSCRQRMRLDDMKPVLPLVQNMLNRLNMICDFRVNGCEDKIPLEMFENHIKNCDFEYLDCRFKPCKQRDLRKIMKVHEANECEFREILCNKQCGLMIPIKEISGHDCLTALKKKCDEHIALAHNLKKELAELKEKLRKHNEDKERHLQRRRAVLSSGSDTYWDSTDDSSDAATEEFSLRSFLTGGSRNRSRSVTDNESDEVNVVDDDDQEDIVPIDDEVILRLRNAPRGDSIFEDEDTTQELNVDNYDDPSAPVTGSNDRTIEHHEDEILYARSAATEQILIGNSRNFHSAPDVNAPTASSDDDHHSSHSPGLNRSYSDNYSQSNSPPSSHNSNVSNSGNDETPIDSPAVLYNSEQNEYSNDSTDANRSSISDRHGVSMSHGEESDESQPYSPREYSYHTDRSNGTADSPYSLASGYGSLLEHHSTPVNTGCSDDAYSRDSSEFKVNYDVSRSFRSSDASRDSSDSRSTIRDITDSESDHKEYNSNSNVEDNYDSENGGVESDRQSDKSNCRSDKHDCSSSLTSIPPCYSDSDHNSYSDRGTDLDTSYLLDENDNCSSHSDRSGPSYVRRDSHSPHTSPCFSDNDQSICSDNWNLSHDSDRLSLNADNDSDAFNCDEDIIDGDSLQQKEQNVQEECYESFVSPRHSSTPVHMSYSESFNEKQATGKHSKHTLQQQSETVNRNDQTTKLYPPSHLNSENTIGYGQSQLLCATNDMDILKDRHFLTHEKLNEKMVKNSSLVQTDGQSTVNSSHVQTTSRNSASHESDSEHVYKCETTEPSSSKSVKKRNKAARKFIDKNQPSLNRFFTSKQKPAQKRNQDFLCVADDLGNCSCSHSDKKRSCLMNTNEVPTSNNGQLNVKIDLSLINFPQFSQTSRSAINPTSASVCTTCSKPVPVDIPPVSERSRDGVVIPPSRHAEEFFATSFSCNHLTSADQSSLVASHGFSNMKFNGRRHSRHSVCGVQHNQETRKSNESIEKTNIMSDVVTSSSDLKQENKRLSSQTISKKVKGNKAVNSVYNPSDDSLNEKDVTLTSSNLNNSDLVDFNATETLVVNGGNVDVSVEDRIDSDKETTN